jgi:hypothetical protein
MSKIPVGLNVDSEVVAIMDAVKIAAIDLKEKAKVSQVGADVFAKLSPELINMANLPTDMKANADNRAYIAMAMEQLTEALMA